MLLYSQGDSGFFPCLHKNCFFQVMPTKQKKSGKDGEISLRPAMHFNSFKPATPNFLPKSAQAPPPPPMSQQVLF